MPMLETPAEVAEAIADMLGVWGAPPDHEECRERRCRVCFVAGITQRIRDAVANEQTLLSGRGEADPVAERAAALDRQWQKQIDIRRGGKDG